MSKKLRVSRIFCVRLYPGEVAKVQAIIDLVRESSDGQCITDHDALRWLLDQKEAKEAIRKGAANKQEVMS